MNLPVISASKLKTHLMCERKYYYQYILKMPRLSNINAVAGTSFHKATEVYNKCQRDPSYWNVFAAEYEPAFIDKKPDIYMAYRAAWDYNLEKNKLADNHHYYGQGQEFLEVYLKNQKYIPISTEEQFRYKFPNEKNPFCIAYGFIDERYDEGHIAARDLKTSSRKISEEEAREDLQLQFYAWVLFRETGQYHTLAWYHAPTGVDVEMTPKDFYSLETNVHKLVNTHTAFIKREEDFWFNDLEETLPDEVVEEFFPRLRNAVPEKKPCSFCDFKEKCLGSS